MLAVIELEFAEKYLSFCGSLSLHAFLCAISSQLKIEQ